MGVHMLHGEIVLRHPVLPIQVIALTVSYHTLSILGLLLIIRVDSILFPTWHRPYCKLFETLIIAEAQQIASQFKTDTAKYQEAARQLRLPFWDWAENPRLPDIATQTTIQIDTPDGPQTVRNPMYQYRFHNRLDPTLFPSNSPDGWFSRFLNTARGINSQRPDTPNSFGNVNSCMQSSDFPGDVVCPHLSPHLDML